MPTTSDGEQLTVIAPARLERSCASCQQHSVAFVARRGVDPELDDTDAVFALARCPRCGWRGDRRFVRSLIREAVLVATLGGACLWFHVWLGFAAYVLHSLFRGNSLTSYVRALRESRRRVKFLSSGDANGPFRGDAADGTRLPLADEPI